MDPTTILIQVVGCGEFALTLLFLITAKRYTTNIRSILKFSRIFVLAWLLLSAVAVAAVGPSNALVGVGVSGGILGSLCHPAFAVSFLIGNLLIRPWEVLPTGNLFEILPRGLAAVCLFSLFLEQLRRVRARIILTVPTLLFFALAGWLLLSAATCTSPSESTSFIIAALVPAAVVVLVTENAVTEEWCIKVAEGAFAISVVTIASAALVVTGYKTGLIGAGIRLVSFGQWGNSNDLAALFVVAFSFLLFRLRSFGSVIWRFAFGYTSLLLLVVTLVLTQSRGGLMSLAVGFLPYLYDRRHRPAVVGVALAALVVIFVGAALIFSRDTGDLEGSRDSRLNYAVVGLRMVKSNPLFGVGPGNYPSRYESFSTVFSEFGQRNAHSIWIVILSEGGIPAFILFVAFWWFAFKAVLRARVRFPEITAAFLSYFTAVSFLSLSYALATYFIITLGLAAGRLAKSTTTTIKSQSN